MPEPPIGAEVSFVPQNLSEAQSDMFARMPEDSASAWDWAAFHRHNAEMFYLAGERLTREGRHLEDDFSSWCYELQQDAVRKHMLQFYREGFQE